MTQVTLPEEGLGIIFGTHDEHLKRIERTFGVEVAARGSELRIEGDPERVETVERLLDGLSELARQGYRLRPSDVTTAIRVMSEDPATSLTSFFQPEGMLGQVRRLIQPRTLKQMLYMQAMVDNDLVISIGPAGTGKTYLAVAVAAAYLLEKKVRRIVLARPAVEAGEKLGFLPGDLVEKVNPYLRPLYDALYDMVDPEGAQRLLERNLVEVAPLAFMRGRAQPVDSRVLTPEGWRRIGSLEVGDTLIIGQAVTGMAEMLGSILGPAGFFVYAVGFWAAVFASLLGVWQSLPYLFTDFLRLRAGRRAVRQRDVTPRGAVPFPMILEDRGVRVLCPAEQDHLAAGRRIGGQRLRRRARACRGSVERRPMPPGCRSRRRPGAEP